MLDLYAPRTHTHTHTQTHTHTHSLTHSLTLSLSLSLTHAHDALTIHSLVYEYYIVHYTTAASKACQQEVNYVGIQQLLNHFRLGSGFDVKYSMHL
jgi:hypothetical protein